MKQVSRHTGNRRLLKLAAFLDTVPPSRFDYNQWVGEDWRGDPALSCGTSACALGWATTMPTFRRLGLALRRVHGLGTAEVVMPRVRVPRTFDRSFTTGAKLFGISYDESRYLFSTLGDARKAWEVWTPNDVAEKIRRFVAARSVASSLQRGTYGIGRS